MAHIPIKKILFKAENLTIEEFDSFRLKVIETYNYVLHFFRTIRDKTRPTQDFILNLPESIRQESNRTSEMMLGGRTIDLAQPEGATGLDGTLQFVRMDLESGDIVFSGDQRALDFLLDVYRRYDQEEVEEVAEVKLVIGGCIEEIVNSNGHEFVIYGERFIEDHQEELDDLVKDTLTDPISELFERHKKFIVIRTVPIEMKL